MFPLSFFLLAVLLVSIGGALVTLIFWKIKVIRYFALAVALCGGTFLYRFWSTDPDTREKGRAWYGRYAISGCAYGSPWDGVADVPLLKLSADQVCSLQDSPTDENPRIGKWSYICTEDWCYVEVEIPEGSKPIELSGYPDSFTSNSRFPIGECE
jgi:hypothetical protein